MIPRFFVDAPPRAGVPLSLPPRAVRHVQVLRLRDGAPITLFDGTGLEWPAEVRSVRRDAVLVMPQAGIEVDRESPVAVTLALGMPANDRMDTLVEKATELGVATIQPLVCERSVLRVEGERADRKVAHWRAVATAACEQCGRNRVPRIAEVAPIGTWLDGLADEGAARWLLSLRDAAPRPAAAASAVVVLSGPEGGFTEAEEALARARGFRAVSLGPRVLRADTAPLALLSALTLP